MAKKIKLFDYCTGGMTSLQDMLKDAEKAVNNFSTSHNTQDIHVSTSTTKSGETHILFGVVYDG